MKKVLTLIASILILSMGSVFAQTTATQDAKSHDVEITIPSVVRIRLATNATTTNVTSPDAVRFNITSFVPGVALAPTNETFNWDRVIVLSNKSSWSVTVALSNTSLPTGVTSFDWSKVSVNVAANNSFTPANFNLGVDPTTKIATGPGKTESWQSLGFGPQSFRLTLDGTEDPGTYKTTVTYTITAP
jgi:hypothetical protein